MADTQDTPWMQSEGLGSPAWLISSMPSEASTLLLDLGQGGSGPHLTQPSSYSIAGPKVARRQRKPPYLDAMTIKADHHKSVVDPTSTQHGRLLIEPTIVPDLDHTGVKIGLKPVHKAAGQGPGDLPSMFYPNGGKSVSMTSAIQAHLHQGLPDRNAGDMDSEYFYGSMFGSASSKPGGTRRTKASSRGFGQGFSGAYSVPGTGGSRGKKSRGQGGSTEGSIQRTEGAHNESYILQGSQESSEVGFVDQGDNGETMVKPAPTLTLQLGGSRLGGMPRLRTSLVIGKGMTSGAIVTAAKQSRAAESVDLIRAIRSTSSRMNNAISKQPAVARPERGARVPLSRSRNPSEISE